MKRKPRSSNAVGATESPALRERPRRDPLTRLLFFCEIIALGMVAAAFYMTFPNDLNRAGTPPVGLEKFATWPEKAAYIAVHTRTAWMTCAILSLAASVLAFQNRRAPRRSRIVAWSPAAVLLVIAVHAGFQGWMQSRGSLSLDFRDASAPAARLDGMEAGTVTISGPDSQPIQIGFRPSVLTRLTVPQGTAAQWQLLFGGDLLFSVPLIFAWLLSHSRVKDP
jgi:hypothetical protein